jgi:hypothetical protein
MRHISGKSDKLKKNVPSIRHENALSIIHENPYGFSPYKNDGAIDLMAVFWKHA